MWNETIKIVKNIVDFNKNNIDNLPAKISNFFCLHIEENIKNTAINFTSGLNLEFEELFNLANTCIEQLNYTEDRIIKSKLNNFEEGLIKSCFIDFNSERELNSWLKNVLKKQIFRTNIEIIDEDMNTEFRNLVLEYQNSEIFPFYLPIEFFKLLLIKNLKMFLPDEIDERNSSNYDGMDDNDIHLNFFKCCGNPDSLILRFLESGSTVGDFNQIINNSPTCGITFSQKVENENLKVKMGKQMTSSSYFKYNNVIKISFFTESSLEDECIKTTVNDLYNGYFRSMKLYNGDEISMCVESDMTKKDAKVVNCEFRELFKTNLKNLVLSNRFLLIKSLCHGNFSEINVGIDLITYKLHCIKRIKGNIYEKEYLSNCLKEANIIKELNNSTISRFIPIYVDTVVENGSLFIITELLGDNLLVFNQIIREKKDKFLMLKVVQKITRQLLFCLRELHEKYGIIHCDIKPENIVLNSIDSFNIFDYFRCNIDRCLEFDIKLIDWGSYIRTSISLDMKDSYLQSRYYRSPEICLGLPFDEKIDIWSVGCIIVELIIGKPLFGDVRTTQQLLANIVSVLGKIPISMITRSTTIKHFLTFDGHLYEKIDSNKLRVYTSFNQEYSNRKRLRELLDYIGEPLLVDLIEKLLSIDPKERFSASKALEHPWFKYNYVDLV